MRRWIGVAGIAGTLVLLYALLGFALAPRLIESRLVEAALNHGLEARVETIRANPFLLTVNLQGVRLLDRDRDVLHVSAKHATLDLTWASLWRRTWIVDRATLEEPELHLTLKPGTDADQKTSQGDTPGSETLAAVLVERLTVSGGAVRLVDRTRDVPAELRLDAIEIGLTDLSTRASAPPGEYELAARIASGGTISMHGTFALEPLAARGKLAISDLPLSTVARLAAPALPVARKGRHRSRRLTFTRKAVSL
ncbi:MAG: DUF748 domain-containing protein [Betaproteobacteria bacterium]